MINNMIKSSSERVNFTLQFTVGRDLEAGPQSNAAWWPISYGLLSLLFHTTQDRLLKGQPLIKTYPTELPTGLSYRGIFSIKIPSYQTCLYLSQLDKKQPSNTHTHKHARMHTYIHSETYTHITDTYSHTHTHVLAHLQHTL